MKPMIKKHISIVFLFIANLLLLVHSVVPHHHHREQLCIEQDHCNDCDHEYVYTNHSKHHSSEGPNYCLVRSVYAVPVNKVAQQNVAVIQLLGIMNYANIELPDLTAQQSKLIGKIPDKPNLYSYLASSSFGLRAPPVI